MAERDEAIRAAARRHGLSEDAVEALWDALVRGRGQAQFSHPDLGGMGQWSGGMLQIGDMFNARLKAKIAAACADLAPQADLALQAGESRDAAEAANRGQQWPRSVAPEVSLGRAPHRTSVPRTGFVACAGGLNQRRSTEPSGGWRGRYGSPQSSGSQNGFHYAYYPERHRLVVDREGRVTVYDTGHHRLAGVSQQQGHDQSLVFTSQHGPIGLDSLVEVDE